MNNTFEKGRSMIEMLGVLAIIGVLSVVGISGYSKAMGKWRSNIQRNLISQLVRTTLELRSHLGGQHFTFKYITYILNDLGEIPDETFYENGKIYDKYGTKIELAYGMRTQVNQQNQTFKIFQLLIYLTFYQTDTTSTPSVKELCRNIILSLIPVANEVQEITVWYSDAASWNNTSGISLYTNKTLPNATISDINQKCNITFPENGYAHFTISLNPY